MEQHARPDSRCHDKEHTKKKARMVSNSVFEFYLQSSFNELANKRHDHSIAAVTGGVWRWRKPKGPTEPFKEAIHIALLVQAVEILEF